MLVVVARRGGDLNPTSKNKKKKKRKRQKGKKRKKGKRNFWECFFDARVRNSPADRPPALSVHSVVARNPWLPGKSSLFVPSSNSINIFFFLLFGPSFLIFFPSFSDPQVSVEIRIVPARPWVRLEYVCFLRPCLCQVSLFFFFKKKVSRICYVSGCPSARPSPFPPVSQLLLIVLSCSQGTCR